jgi:hypothetical protein
MGLPGIRRITCSKTGGKYCLGICSSTTSDSRINELDARILSLEKLAGLEF